MAQDIQNADYSNKTTYHLPLPIEYLKTLILEDFIIVEFVLKLAVVVPKLHRQIFDIWNSLYKGLEKKDEFYHGRHLV